MKKIRLLLFSTAAVLLLILLMIPAKVQADGLPFSVSPVMPSVQRQRSENYFDVLVKNGKSVKLQVRLTNRTTHALKVDVHINAGQTSDNGTVDYSLKQTKDATLGSDIADLLIGPKSVTIPAKHTGTYTAVLSMPERGVAGLVSGGLIFSPATDKTDNAQSGIAIRNRYQYIVAVVARSKNQIWQPKLRIQRAQIRQDRYQNTLAIPLHNVSATFLNQLRVQCTVVNLTTGKKLHRTTSSMQMAPNSHFFFRMHLPTKRPAGTYRVQTTAYFVQTPTGRFLAGDGKHYQYRQEKTSTVRLSATRAKQLNSRIKQAKGGTPWFIYVVIIGFALLLVVIVLLVAILLKRRRKQV